VRRHVAAFLGATGVALNQGADVSAHIKRAPALLEFSQLFFMNEAGSSPAPAPEPKKRAWLVWPGAVVLAVLLYFGIGYLVEIFTHESTDDAFIAGHIISIAPRISGQVVAVPVNDNQMVRSNDLLVEIDPADYAMVVSQKEAAAEAQQSSYKTMLAAWQLMQAKVTTAEAGVRKAQADADAAESTAKKTQADIERARDLLKQKTVSQQEFDATQAADTKAQADLKSAREKVVEATSLVEEANRTLAAAWAQAGTVLSQWQEAQTNIAAAKIDLAYTRIFAPAAGRVTRKAVEAGDYLQAGQQIMSIVPTEVWVVANFKESQLKDMAPGQPVTVEIDALGGREFAAHVDSVQAGSGAQFSLLPPENATGNYVKVVQRVPVKIVFDEPLPADKVIGPGLSVTPNVQVSKFVFPAWAIALIALFVTVASVYLFFLISGRKSNE
jgi:membrane fusion protein, multidrug efflux system